MSTKHAKLSASGASRWMACPASVALEEDFPDTSSEAATEGTHAHELAERKLADYFGIKHNINIEPLDGEMEEKTDEFVSYVIEIFNKMKKKHKETPEIFLEQRLDFSQWVPDGFGTGDVTILCGSELHIIDLKYGKGVPVSALENPQLRLYGLGSYNEFGFIYDLKFITMHIVQPRLDSSSSERLSVKNLLKWAKDIIVPAAQDAANGGVKQQVGDHCRFCKAMPVCRAQAEHNLQIARHEFKNPARLAIQEIADIITQSKDLTTWVKAVNEYALTQALSGEKVPGYKVVEGRSNRKYSDQIEVAEKLIENGFEEPVIFEKKLLGLTAMEKMIGDKKRFDDLLGELIIKPEGKPALVVETDKRPVYASATKDFEIIK